LNNVIRELHVNGREFKDLIYEQFGRMANAFSSPKRLEIVDLLAQGERDVESLSKLTSMTMANTSRHLQILKAARLVDVRREGVRIFYRLADAQVLQCWMGLQSLAEKRTAEVREIARLFFEERDAMEAISIDELWNRTQNNDVVVLDVRPSEEYKNGHIAGAISIPLSELKNRLDEVPLDHDVVAYCRGPYCVLSAEAVTILRDAGLEVVRLRDGFHEWRLAGLPVEQA
jgi:rhodanese-related sulfurtransferase